MITQDKVLDGTAIGYLMECNEDFGPRLRQPIRTRDGKTYDTSGAYLVGQLERYDQTAHPPLSSVTWDRDLPIRDDVTYGDEEASFTQQTFSTPGGPGTGSKIGQKRSVIGKLTTQIAEVAVDVSLVKQPLITWGEGLSYTLPELASSLQTGRPIDQQKLAALDLEHQLQTDAQAYLGWEGNGTFGLINSPKVATTNLPNGAANGSRWMPRTGYLGKTPAEILADLGNMVYAPWAASAFSVKPNRLLLDPQNFNYIRTVPASAAGSKSILQYFLESQNSDPSESDPLRVLPLKWLTDSGAGNEPMGGSGINRSVAYNKSETFPYVRFPLTMLQRTPLEYTAMSQRFYKWGKLGACEFIYPETVAYFDGN